MSLNLNDTDSMRINAQLDTLVSAIGALQKSISELEDAIDQVCIPKAPEVMEANSTPKLISPMSPLATKILTMIQRVEVVQSDVSRIQKRVRI